MMRERTEMRGPHTQMMRGSAGMARMSREMMGGAAA